jgi:transcriptional regulator with XRE-family HTH domain
MLTIRRTTTNSAPLADTPLAQALYAQRTRRGLSLQRAATQAHISLATMHRLETRANMPSLPVLLRAAQWLGVKPGTLIRSAS